MLPWSRLNQIEKWNQFNWSYYEKELTQDYITEKIQF